ncbi:uncharacterized protein VTP21DRAFT_4105 [Calcarisporiella thermophila]|uniref:uncharacterized protein n=1 Tax=Calcarisporiella thermophila TaxID=911321 RepID=UPI0037428E3D
MRYVKRKITTIMQSSSIGTIHADNQGVILAGNTRGNVSFYLNSNSSSGNVSIGAGAFKVLPRNWRFVDRPQLMKRLDEEVEIMKKNQKYKPIALCGLGGVGKSQLALEYCYRKKNEYRYVFWLESDKESMLQSAFLDVARRLKIVPIGSHIVNPEDILPCVLEWLQYNDEWLLVYDNADDYSLGNQSNPFFLQTKYFPQYGNGTILVTTRLRYQGYSMVPIYFEEYPMRDDAALRLLGKDEGVPYALELVKELEYLPLAIDLAGASMKMDSILTPEKYLSSYRSTSAECLNYLDLQEIAKLTDSNYGKTVLTVWTDTFHRIKKGNPLAASLFQSIVLLDPDNIPVDLFHDQYQMVLGSKDERDSRELKRALMLLQDYGLIRESLFEDRNAALFPNGSISVHRVVQRVTALEIEEVEKRKRYERIILALRQVVPENYYISDDGSRKMMEVYAPHILYVGQQFALCNAVPGNFGENSNIKEEFVCLLIPTISFFVGRALFEEAEYLAKLAVTSSTTIEDPLYLAKAESSQCYLLSMKGDFISAEKHCRNALKIRKSLLTIKHELTRSSIHYLDFILKKLDVPDPSLSFELWMAKEIANSVAIEYEYGRIDFTPLHRSVEHFECEDIRKFAKHYRSYVNIGDKIGATPLHWAARWGKNEVVKLLVTEFGATVDIEDEWKSTPSSRIMTKFVEKLVIECVAKVYIRDKFTGRSGLSQFIAIYQDRMLVEDLGAKIFIRVNHRKTSLHWAAREGRAEAVRVLATEFEAEVNIRDSERTSPLHLASCNCSGEIVKMLVTECGAEVNVKNRDGRAPLHLAAKGGMDGVVMILVAECSAEVNIKDNEGRAPLHLAAEAAQVGKDETEKMLVTVFNAKVNIKDNWRGTPLHWAAHKCNGEVVKVLVAEFGAEVNTKDEEGRTPLHLSAERCNYRVVKMLVTEFGAEVNIQDRWGGTPMHLAAEGDRDEIVEMTEFGAELHIAI